LTTHIALLRGINVGGHKQVAMADLRAMLERLGFHDAQSVLQSGNLVFRSEGKAGARLEQLLETEARKRLKLEAAFMIRSAAEWKQLVAENPFPAKARGDPARLVVVFLKEAPGAAAMKALQASIVGREVVRAKGKHLYAVYPDGQGRSKLTNAVIEKQLGTRGTARNWNTVQRLGAVAGAL
jgi:uncharacterized protein (DUF1697 family)